LERAVGKFLPIIHHDLPPKPVDIATNKEARHSIIDKLLLFIIYKLKSLRSHVEQE